MKPHLWDQRATSPLRKRMREMWKGRSQECWPSRSGFLFHLSLLASWQCLLKLYHLPLLKSLLLVFTMSVSLVNIWTANLSHANTQITQLPIHVLSVWNSAKTLCLPVPHLKVHLSSTSSLSIPVMPIYFQVKIQCCNFFFEKRSLCSYIVKDFLGYSDFFGIRKGAQVSGHFLELVLSFSRMWVPGIKLWPQVWRMAS